MYNKALAVTLLMLATPAMAGELSYSYVEAGYQRADIEIEDVGFGTIDLDGDAIGANFSFEVGDNFFLTGGFATADLEFEGIDVADQDTLRLGVGYHAAVSDRADFYGVLSWVNAEISVDGFGSVDEDGYGMTVGLRSYVTDQLELEGHIGYIDLGDGGDGTSIGGSALYEFTQNFAAGVFVGFEDDASAYGIGARVYFGR